MIRAREVRPITESVVEEAALAWLEGLGHRILSGPENAPGKPFAERDDYGQVMLKRRLRVRDAERFVMEAL